jgi:NAD(P)H dehydrogenase (quinone)
VIGTTGATGEVGGRLAHRLAERGVRQRLIVRDASRAPALRDADVIEFGGYTDRRGMEQAFAGLSTLFLVSARESADRLDQHKAAVDAAAATGVERIGYLSFIGAAADATFTFARDHFRTEEHIRNSGLGFTFSRQNLYMDFLPMLGGEQGVIRGPAEDGRAAPVLRDDVAEALTTLLTEPGHEGATYELTGPESLTMGEIAALVTEFSEQKVVFENETLEEAYASRSVYGAPDWEVEGWITTYTAIAAGELDVITDHVWRLTGHQPVSAREFLSTR